MNVSLCGVTNVSIEPIRHYLCQSGALCDFEARLVALKKSGGCFMHAYMTFRLTPSLVPIKTQVSFHFWCMRTTQILW